jgi:hypothetical protein
LERGNLKRSHSGAKRSDRLATFFGGLNGAKVSVVKVSSKRLTKCTVVKDLGCIFEKFDITQKGFQ